MAGFKETDASPLADALVLAALFLPFFPIVATAYTGTMAVLFGCPADVAQACHFSAIDLNALYANAAAWLNWSAKAASSGALLAYICGLALLAQLTTEGFRGRIVRTCAVIMWAGVLPLVLGIADILARSPERLCGGGPCSPDTMLPAFGFLGEAFINWVANIAVPLGVMVSLLVAMAMGYRVFVSRFVRLVTRRN